MKKRNKDYKKFFRQEWKDAEKLLGMNKEQLLWQIWEERSWKSIFIIANILQILIIIMVITK